MRRLPSLLAVACLTGIAGTLHAADNAETYREPVFQWVKEDAAAPAPANGVVSESLVSQADAQRAFSLRSDVLFPWQAATGQPLPTDMSDVDQFMNKLLPVFSMAPDEDSWDEQVHRGITSGMAYYLTPSLTLEEEDFFSGQLLDSNDAFERQDVTLFLVRFSF